ncbi:Ceramide kinase, partial [Fragariocoptes setiger]
KGETNYPSMIMSECEFNVNNVEINHDMSSDNRCITADYLKIGVSLDRIIAVRACYCARFDKKIKICTRCLELDEQQSQTTSHKSNNRSSRQSTRLSHVTSSSSTTPVPPHNDQTSQYGESDSADSGHYSAQITSMTIPNMVPNKLNNNMSESGISLGGDSSVDQRDLKISGVRVYYAKQVLGPNKIGVFKLKTLAFEEPKFGAQRDSLHKLVSCFQQLIDSVSSNRPRRLLIFVNPFGGKGRALKIYTKRVAPLLRLARVDVDLVTTEYANHARKLIEDESQPIESTYDGIISVGGDGMFSELINGILSRVNRDKIVWHDKTIYSSNNDNNNDNNNNNGDDNTNRNLNHNDNNPKHVDSNGKSVRRYVTPSIPIGIIGAGSTDANAFGVYGTNDTRTAVINIILGRTVNIDVCSVHDACDDSLIRFVTTMIAYGYFGDVMRESETMRWLGPSRYDVAGVKRILRNKAYEGEIRAVVTTNDGTPDDSVRCGRNCDRCFTEPASITVSQAKTLMTCDAADDELQYVRQSGSFISINACLMPCRCSQSKIGLAPNAHLANGCIDLILVKRCSRANYLNFLARTAGAKKKSALDLHCVQSIRCREFEFVPKDRRSESNKATDNKNNSNNDDTTTNYGYIDNNIAMKRSINNNRDNDKHSLQQQQRKQKKLSKTSVWNADGELIQEAAIRVKVNRQLLLVFGSGEPYKLDN